ncbi:MAG TPA: hypothetical protein VFA54_12975 [Bryobacterales bacterium]|jgi:hypothetical protein|nr:hypothetical protein [Bryobacterales bacterium]
MRYGTFAIVSILFCGSLISARADGLISGPTLGYLWDQQYAGLRPILGIPGASVVGPVMNLGGAFRSVEVSPGLEYALAIAAGSGKVLLVDLRTGAPAGREIDGALINPARIIFSPLGRFAGLYDSQLRSVQVIGGLPDAPAIAGTADLSGPPSVLTAMAISDQDGLVLAAASENRRGSVFAVSPGNPPRFVAQVGRASALSFLEGSQDALIADYDRSELLLVRDVQGAAQALTLAGPADGIANPIAIASAGRDGRVLAISESQITVLDLNGSAPAALPCACSLSGIHRLSGNGVFRLDSAAGKTLLLDAGASNPRILFVPSADSASVSPPRLPGFSGRIRR